MKKINSFEYNTIIWFLIRATFIEITVSILLTKAHQDALLSIIIGIIFGLIPFSIYAYLKNKYPDKNIIDINKTFGKLGTFINLITIGGIFLFTICSFWILVHFIDSQYLYHTPTSIIIAVLILPIIYASLKPMHIFSKVSLIMFYISLIFIIIILTGLVGNIDIENLKPILNENPSNVLSGTFYFIGFNILPLFVLLIIPKNNINNYSSKKTLLFYFLGTISLLNVLFLTVSIFGIHLAELYNYPSFHLLKRVSVLDVIDRAESILSLEWFLALFVQITTCLYFIKESIKQTFKTKEKTNNIIIFIVCLIIAFLTNFIFTTKSTEIAYFKNILIYILYFICLVLPLFTAFKSLKKS